jgi:hypothetical protein
MVKDVVLCSNPVPDGSAARALAGCEPDAPPPPLVPASVHTDSRCPPFKSLSGDCIPTFPHHAGSFVGDGGRRT